MNYLFDILITPSTEEWKIWKKSAQEFFTWLGQQLTARTLSHAAVVKESRNTILKLEKSFQNITGQKLDITSYHRISIQDYLKQRYSKYYRLYHFNETIFGEALNLKVRLLLMRNEALYDSQIEIIAFKMLFNQFLTYQKDVFGENQWEFTGGQIMGWINSILKKDIRTFLQETETELIEPLKKSLLSANIKKEENMELPKNLGKKPFNAQCILDLFEGYEYLTQGDKINLLMERYGYSRSSAVRDLKKFGLYERKWGKDVITQEDPVEDKISILMNEIALLKEENQKLREENQKLLAAQTKNSADIKEDFSSTIDMSANKTSIFSDEDFEWANK